MTEPTNEREPYTVHARIIVRAEGPFSAEVAARTMVGDASVLGEVIGLHVEAVEPSDPADVAWAEATA